MTKDIKSTLSSLDRKYARDTTQTNQYVHTTFYSHGINVGEEQ